MLRDRVVVCARLNQKFISRSVSQKVESKNVNRKGYLIYTLTHRSQTNLDFRFSSSQALIMRRMTIETSILDSTLLKLMPLLLPHRNFRSFFKLGRSSNGNSQEKIRLDFGISFHLIDKLIHRSYRTQISCDLFNSDKIWGTCQSVTTQNQVLKYISSSCHTPVAQRDGIVRPNHRTVEVVNISGNGEEWALKILFEKNIIQRSKIKKVTAN